MLEPAIEQNMAFASIGTDQTSRGKSSRAHSVAICGKKLDRTEQQKAEKSHILTADNHARGSSLVTEYHIHF